MKKITLLLVMLLAVMGVNAKSRTTTLWEGTDTGADIEVAKNELVKGATLNLTFNWLGSDGAQFSCFWWDSSTSAWVKIKDWQWVNNGESYSFTLTDDEFDAITNDKLCFKTEAVSKMTFAKITQTETFVPTSVSDNLLSEDWESSKETAKILSAVSDAKIGDVLQFTVSANAWDWVQFKLTDKDGNVDQFTGAGSEPQGNNGNTSFTLEFIISNLHDLKKIKNDGFGFIQTGNNAFTMTAVNLLTYSDSYGYITITIPEVGCATWSSDKKYDFKSAGLQAYYASDVTTGSVTLTPMDITWDYQGYIIKGSKGEYDVLESLTTDGSYYPNGNYLKYNIDEAEVYDSGKNRYIFAMKNDDASSVGFYKLTANHTLGAHKAYLETAEDIAPTPDARVALIFDDGEATSISEKLKVKSEKFATATDCYDLMGRKVAQPTRGLYIVNGKKVVVK